MKRNYVFNVTAVFNTGLRDLKALLEGKAFLSKLLSILVSFTFANREVKSLVTRCNCILYSLVKSPKNLFTP